MKQVTVMGVLPSGQTNPIDPITLEALNGVSSLEEVLLLGETIGAIKAFGSLNMDGEKSDLVKELAEKFRALTIAINHSKRSTLMGKAAITLEAQKVRSLLNKDEPELPPIQFEWSVKGGRFLVFECNHKSTFLRMISPSKIQYEEITNWLTEFCGDPIVNNETGARNKTGQWVVTKFAKRVVDLPAMSRTDGSFTQPNKGEIFAGENEFRIEMMIPTEIAPVFKMRFNDWF